MNALKHSSALDRVYFLHSSTFADKFSFSRRMLTRIHRLITMIEDQGWKHCCSGKGTNKFDTRHTVPTGTLINTWDSFCCLWYDELSFGDAI